MPRHLAHKPASKPKTGKFTPPAAPRLSRTRRPVELGIADWQSALCRQFGREQRFDLENLGSEPVFSDFRVHNPDSGTHYRVAIRGRAPGQNFCTCPDFATNHLGTCKHIEFTLARLERKRGGKTALARGFVPAYSEIWLDYTGLRQVRFRAGTACPPAVLVQATSLFDVAAGWSLPRDRQGGLLVVCPTSLKHQWQKELARFTDHQAQVIHGLRARRQLQYREDVLCKITHYETLTRRRRSAIRKQGVECGGLRLRVGCTNRYAFHERPRT